LAKGNYFVMRVVTLGAVWVMLLVLAMSSLTYLSSLFSNNPERHNISSLSWAGYVVANDFITPEFEVVAINASWVVPTVNNSNGAGYSSAWIGIGGQLDTTLIQVGTEHNVVNGQVTYNAWYEMLPDFAIKIEDMSIRPQDTVMASLTLINPDTDEWSIQIRDVTNGQGFGKNVIYNSSCSSGDWITERPTVNRQISSLSDFGNVTFKDCFVTINNATGRIGNFSYSKVDMINQQNFKLASVSSLGGDGSSFTVSYQASG
jgi:hypothetical protein